MILGAAAGVLYYNLCVYTVGWSCNELLLQYSFKLLFSMLLVMFWEDWNQQAKTSLNINTVFQLSVTT